LRGIVEGSNPPSEGVDNPQTGSDESVPCLSQFVGASRKHSGKHSVKELFYGMFIYQVHALSTNAVLVTAR